MSVHISARAWLVDGLPFAEKLVLLKLADMANDEGVCWPSNAKIAAQCGVDLRSVRRITARLEARGLLRRAARFGPKGLQTSNWLTVLPPDDRRAAAAAGEGPAVPEGDRAVLPAKGDRSVLPARTGRSSLGGTGRSSKPSSETSKNLPAGGKVAPAACSASSRGETSQAEGACEGEGAGGVVSASEALASACRKADLAAACGLAVRSPVSGEWLTAADWRAQRAGQASADAMNGEGGKAGAS